MEDVISVAMAGQGVWSWVHIEVAVCEKQGSNEGPALWRPSVSLRPLFPRGAPEVCTPDAFSFQNRTGLKKPGSGQDLRNSVRF